MTPLDVRTTQEKAEGVERDPGRDTGACALWHPDGLL